MRKSTALPFGTVAWIAFCLLPTLDEYLGWLIICCTERHLVNFYIWFAILGVMLTILAGLVALVTVRSSDDWHMQCRLISLTHKVGTIYNRMILCVGLVICI